MDIDDDNLFMCDEVLMMKEENEIIKNKQQHHFKEDCEEALQICINNELDFLPQFGYLTHIRSSGLLFPRFKSLQSIIKSQCRLNLSYETVFNAANYLDRFISINQCHGWKDWMMDLLTVACLSVASKFGETEAHTLHEIQMKGLKLSSCFEIRLIQRMELSLMNVLKWRLMSSTTFSYVELLTSTMSTDHFHFKQGSIDLLLANILDTELVEFRPSVVATASLMCIIKKWNHHHHQQQHEDLDDYLAYITGLIPQNQMDDLIKCEERMNEDDYKHKHKHMVSIGDGCYGKVVPSSPNTVLGGEDQMDLSNFFKIF